MKTTVCIVPFNNDDRFRQTLKKVQNADGDFRIIVVDNSKRPLNADVEYYHNRNEGMLAGACNFAVSITDTEYFTYVCSNHCKFYSNDWLTEMVGEMDAMPDVAMAGTILPHKGIYHVQGGLFIARTDVLRANRYQTKYPFRFMDVYMSERLTKRGHKLGTIRSIYSVWSAKDWTKDDHMYNKHTKKYKAVHGRGAF